MTQLVQALLSSTQKTLSEWNQKIRTAIEKKEQERANYGTKKQQVLPMLIDAYVKGVSSRELERITGINHTTISRWVKEAQRQKAKEDVHTE